MTLEELAGEHQAFGSMEKVGDALEEVLSKALTQRSITIGVYEAAKLLNVDPDNVVLCLLAADEEDDQDVALQIHFTLIQAFCCENDINILRVSNPSRLAELLLLGAGGGGEQPPDLHCVLVTRQRFHFASKNYVACTQANIYLPVNDESTCFSVEGSSPKSADLLLPGKPLYGSVGPCDQPS